jgi:aryl-alcohol dehydrogenase-like predicted oxidoreductase
MNYRKLGNSDLMVSEVALGSWLTYGAGVVKTQAIGCVRKALDLGITLIDTSNIYGRGAAETLLGDALQGVDRSSYVLATKLFFPMTETDRGLSREQIKKQLDASLKRMKTDYVDLYQCHRYDPETPLEETMTALTDAVQSGKVRYIGFSEWPVEKIQAALDIPKVARFVSSQPQYSLLWRQPEKEVIPLCTRQGISQIVWSPLAQGVLTGKYRPGMPPPADSRAASSSMGGFLGKDRLNDRVLQAVQNLVPVAREAELTLSQLALAWVLRDPNVASAIIGATKPEHVTENVGASGHKISEHVLALIDVTLAPALAA